MSDTANFWVGNDPALYEESVSFQHYFDLLSMFLAADLLATGESACVCVNTLSSYFCILQVNRL